MEQAIEIYNIFSAASSGTLKKAFWNKTRKISANFKKLGRSIEPNTVWKMTEKPTGVRRANDLVKIFRLLGACFMESPQTFDILWLFIKSYVAVLRGNARIFRSPDEAFTEFRYACVKAERAYFQGNIKEIEPALIYVDECLKGTFATLQVID